MKKYYFIAAGGALGALLRFELKSSPNLFQFSDPLINLALTILLINLFGCLILGSLNAVFSKTERISTDVKLGLTAGLVGAFTTYSTFCKESLNILDAGYLRFFVTMWRPRLSSGSVRFILVICLVIIFCIRLAKIWSTASALIAIKENS